MNKIKVMYKHVTLAFLMIVGAALIVSCSSAKESSSDVLARADSEQSVYTCSMHPNVRNNGPGKCPICGMDLIPVGNSDSDDLGERRIRLSESARKLAEIEVTPVQSGTLSRSIRLLGQVDYNETAVRTISAWFPGRIERMHVSFTGEQIKSGAPMVDIYSPELISAQEEFVQSISASQKLSESHLPIASASAERSVASARKKLQAWGLSGAQIALLESESKTTDNMTIQAPISGIVIEKHVTEGDYVKEGSDMFAIADLSTVWALFDAYESDLTWIAIDDEVTFRVKSFPGEDFAGKVSFIDPFVNPKTRSAQVRVTASNRDGKLKPGMLADGIVMTKTPDGKDETALMIPASAPLITGKRAVVYVQDPADASIYEGRIITLGPRMGEKYVVVDGLHEGELVVSRGAFKIDATMQIQAKPSMMSSGGSPVGGHMHHGTTGPETKPGDNNQSSEIHDEDEAATLADADCPELKTSLAAAYDSYFKLQVALTEDSYDRAAVHAGEFTSSLPLNIPDCLSKKAAGEFRDLLISLTGSAKSIQSSKTINKARVHFETISAGMILAAKKYGVTGADAIYEYWCPMAFNNKGAAWLQPKKGTANPYFGSAMYRCGGVTNTFAAKNSAMTEQAHGESDE